MGEKLNTAEYDKKGRCIRHPAIRLRKKKIFGGWKIIIGHCPECCLDEMRRVRDEIGAENSNDSDYDNNNESPRRRSRKSKDRDRQRKSDKKKKKRRDRDRSNRDRSNRHNVRNEDSFSHSEDIGNSSDGHHHHHHSSSQYMSHNGSSMYLNDNNNIKPRRLDQHVGHPQHKQQLNNNIDDQPSVGTGSTAMNSSMDGTVNSNMSPRVGYPHTGHGGPAGSSGGYQQYQINRNPPPQAANNNYHRHINQSPDNFPSPAAKPPPPPRTMVLSMAFTDPQTGQRGTYTGQVNSINHKPDGKGTVYYANGNIAEGSWSNGILLDDSSGEEDDDDELSGSRHSNNMGNSPSNSQNSRGARNTAPLRGGEEQFVRSASRGGEGYYQQERNSGSRSSSRQGSMRVSTNPGPPLRRSESDRYRSGNSDQRRSSGSFAEQRMNRGGMPTDNNMPSGNLDKLGSLPGNKKRRSKPRGASASVQNVRGQDSFNIPSGSASVQDFRYSGGNASFSGFMDRGGGGVYSDRGDGGSLRDFGTGNDNQRDFGGSTHSMGFIPERQQYNRNPPGYR